MTHWRDDLNYETIKLPYESPRSAEYDGYAELLECVRLVAQGLATDFWYDVDDVDSVLPLIFD